VDEWIRQSLIVAQEAEARALLLAGKEKTRQAREHSSNSEQVIRFKDCAFYGNRQVSVINSMVQYGVVSSLTPFNPLEFSNCLFTENIYNGVDRGNDGTGYAIATGGSPLEIRDCCIFNNEFMGFGVIQQFGGSLEAVNNYAVNNGEFNLTCGFVAKSDLLEPKNVGDITCIAGDADECAGITFDTSSPSIQPLQPPPTTEPSDIPSTQPSSADVTDCFTDITLLSQVMAEADPLVSNVYVLCPNTTFNIGVAGDDGICCTGGMSSLYVQSRSHIKCGESGSSDNNCTLLGGDFQLISGPEPAEEVIIQGVTFEAAEDSGAFLAGRTEVTFLDCLFKVRCSNLLCCKHCDGLKKLVSDKQTQILPRFPSCPIPAAESRESSSYSCYLRSKSVSLSPTHTLQ
jgi:hypothetical protein